MFTVVLSLIVTSVLATPQEPAAGAAGQPSPFVVSTAAGSSTNKVIPIVDGGQSLTFVPNSVTANVGDILQFQFAQRNHTVTQSAENSPCQPLLDTVGNAVHSAFVPFPFNNASSMVGTFNVPVESTSTMLLYCAQGQHCQAGMDMAVNPTSSERVIQYANSAATAKENKPGKFVAGGALGVLPAANAAFTVAENPASPPTSTSSSARISPSPL